MGSTILRTEDKIRCLRLGIWGDFGGDRDGVRRTGSTLKSRGTCSFSRAHAYQTVCFCFPDLKDF